VQVEPAYLGAERALGPWPQPFVVLLVHQRHTVLVQLQEGSAEERQLHARFERRLRRRFVRALFVWALVKHLPAAHPPEHPLGHARDDVRHVRDRGRRARVKDDSAVLASGEDPVERDDVQVHEGG
jgi:hypothetical protein